MIKVSFCVVALLVSHLSVFTATASAQTGTLVSKSQGINSYTNNGTRWSSLSGYIGGRGEVMFDNAYSGGPSDPPNTFEIHIELRDQNATYFDGGLVASVTLAWNTRQTIVGYEQFNISLLNSASVTSVTGKLEAKKVNTPSGYSVYVTDSSAYGWTP